MSNLNQFLPDKGFPLGSTLTMANMGDLYPAADGSRWLSNTPTAPFAYTSDYANTPTNLLAPYAIFPGPYDSKWNLFNSNTQSLAYKATGTLYCTGNYSTTLTQTEGDATNGFIYYTSADAFVTPVRRTFPNNKNYSVAFTAAQFIGFAISSTTNGIITGTNAAAWSNITAASQTTVSDILSNGSTHIVIFPNSGTVANVSVDSGATFASSTITAPGLGASNLNQGGCTFNAGPALFIGSVGTAGQYQTLPAGSTTWTLRSTVATFQPYGVFFGTTCRFASNATVTVALGASGFFATTTDGLVWGNYGWITAGLPPLNGGVSAFYHDGTRFVVLAGDRIFYSTNATSWIEGYRAFGVGSTFLITNDRHVRIAAPNFLSKALLVTDPTLTTPLTVGALVSGSAPATTNIYTRIK